MSSIPEKPLEQHADESGAVHSGSLGLTLLAGGLTAAVVLLGGLGVAKLSIDPLTAGLILAGLGGLTAALTHQFHARRVQADTGYLAEALRQLELPAVGEADSPRLANAA